jgi:hypothetical protein
VVSSRSNFYTLGKRIFFFKLWNLIYFIGQIFFNPKSRRATQFTWKNKYQFKRAIFGLKNIPNVFTKIMIKVLNGCFDYTEMYIDDIIIH